MLDKLDYIKNGDCLDYLKVMPENTIDLTVTSPPYDDLRKYKGYTWDFKNIVNELFRVTKLGGGGCLDCVRCYSEWQRNRNVFQTSPLFYGNRF